MTRLKPPAYYWLTSRDQRGGDGGPGLSRYLSKSFHLLPSASFPAHFRFCIMYRVHNFPCLLIKHSRNFLLGRICLVFEFEEQCILSTWSFSHTNIYSFGKFSSHRGLFEGSTGGPQRKLRPQSFQRNSQRWYGCFIFISLGNIKSLLSL